MIRCLALVWVASATAACASGPTVVGNVGSTADLDPGERLLAGRFHFHGATDRPLHDIHPDFEEWRPGAFTVYINRAGVPSVSALEPDKDGYVCVPVTPGHYNIVQVDARGRVGMFRFVLNPYVQIHVDESDDLVNFGTVLFEFRESQNKESLGTRRDFVGSIGGYRTRSVTTYRYDRTRGFDDNASLTTTVLGSPEETIAGILERLDGRPERIHERVPSLVNR